MPAQPQPIEGAWTPQLQLYATDREIFTQEPFLPALQKFHSTRPNRSAVRGSIWVISAALWQQLQAHLSTPFWFQYASDWLAFCLGGEIVANMPEEEIELSWRVILEVFYLRWVGLGKPDGENDALRVLNAAQVKNFRAYAAPPADFSLQEVISQRDRYSGASECEELEREGSGYRYPEDGDDDDDPMDGDMRDSDYIPDFAYSVPEPFSRDIPDVSEPLSVPSHSMPAVWVKHINLFFYPDNPSPTCKRPKKEVVLAYCQMRDLPKTVYKTPEFRSAMEVSSVVLHTPDIDQQQSSGLMATLYKICRPGNLLETSHGDVQRSFRVHNWKIAFGEIYCRWKPPTLSEDEYEKIRPKANPNSQPRMHPWSYDPFAVYFLTSLAAFEFFSRTWLAPSLKTLEYPTIDGWNAEIVYRTIMQHSLLMDSDTIESRKTLCTLDHRLAVVIHETHLHRKLLARARNEALRPSIPSEPPAVPSTAKASPGQIRNEKKRARGEKVKVKDPELDNVIAEILGTELVPSERQGPCAKCGNENMEDRCVRILEVFEKPNVASLRGVVMTCAPPDDRLKPLPPPKARDGKPAPRPRKICYMNPEDPNLGFIWIKPRQETFKRCSLDITRFVLKHEGGKNEIVGGVRYQAMSPEILAQLLDNHRRVSVRGVRRREDMQAWAYGTMTGSGPRQPMGGAKGDGYGPYACHSGDTPDDIRALFRHAVDTDVLVEIGESIMPGLRTDLKKMTNIDEVTRMGLYGLTTFTCSNYMSVIHPDNDVGLDDIMEKRAKKECRGGCYPCAQLHQSGTNKLWHEWDFVYAGYGLVIETWTNTVWCFNGEVDHGSCMPSQSSIDNNAQSYGKHPTKRQRDAVRAAAIAQVRHAMEQHYAS
ncbi:hypothetical protein C8F04DRAFT_1268767 [Mycena alexandri]|uniref:Uncharacterized protein n=1 Tax=Mycena alexandri TaxID=1745969 RepID=A0AAD6WSV8_9AGAR|nr:hypothetical protein C8F04DRAFT_1268767 [Mycena alexandri]